MANSSMQRAVRQVTDAKEFGKVAVLYGGTSAEREVSLESGAAVHKALLEKGVDAHLVDHAEIFPYHLIEQGFDRVWIALHGRGGEDGSLQGALEQIGIPYTGSGVLGSALGMDKLRCKQVFQSLGMRTPKWISVLRSQKLPPNENVIAELGLPLIVKPAKEGSSIGMTVVKEVSQLSGALDKALACDDSVLIEQFIKGKEVQGGILQGEKLPMIHIQPANEFYDYDAKYLTDTTQYHCPAGLTDEKEAEYRDLSLQAFNAIGAYGWGRVDLLVDENDSAYVLEVNTVPGMTSHSLVPMAAKEVGYSFADLVWKVLETSFVAGE